MAELILERAERLALRAEAHHLAANVLLGNNGFTDAVLKEIDRALTDHGLVKIHVPSDDRGEREEIYHTVAEKLGAARIQMIGKMLVLYRPQPEEKVKTKPSETPIDPRFAGKADPGARGMRKPADPAQKKAAAKKSPSAKNTSGKAKKGARVVIHARKTHKRLTKKAALS